MRLRLPKNLVWMIGFSSMIFLLHPESGPCEELKGNATATEEDWVPLLNGSELGPWEATNFGGEGQVEVKDGTLILHMGSPMTGVTFTGKDFPKDNYEMQWEARRVSGQDFFAGITFPVGDEFCSFIGGGWGGSLTGLSSIDGSDASENSTSGFEDFKNDVWYNFRLRVDEEAIKVWLNGREIINAERDGHQFSVRIEVAINEPVGYCTYNTTAEVRKWMYRPLKPKAEATKKTSMAPSPLEDHDSPDFVRITYDSKREPMTMQTAIVQYAIESGPYAGAKIDLVGAVHVGESTYYADLNRRFKEYEALLFELVADPNVRIAETKKDRGVYNPLSAIQVGMKDALNLRFQLDDIDYSCKNFVHADMTPEEFFIDMKKRQDSVLSTFARILGSSLAAQSTEVGASSDAKILAALMSKNKAIALRRVLAEQFENMDITMMGLEDQNGKSTLLTERNVKALKVLTHELDQGVRRLAIFYGAAHLKDMDRRLVTDYGARRGNVLWLDAWKLSESN